MTMPYDSGIVWNAYVRWTDRQLPVHLLYTRQDTHCAGMKLT